MVCRRRSRTAQFEALRDGDRFHYLWSRPLRRLEDELRREAENPLRTSTPLSAPSLDFTDRSTVRPP